MNTGKSCKNCGACTVLANFQRGTANLAPHHLPQIKALAAKIIQQRIPRVKITGFSYSLNADTSKANKGAERAQIVARVLKSFLDKIKPGSSRTIMFAVKSKVKPNVTDAAQQAQLRRVNICAKTAGVPGGGAGGRRKAREMEYHETALGEIFNEVLGEI